MDSPELSIITPSYNQAEFIEANICSIMSQTCLEIEHIVIDGGSTDHTVDILEKYDGCYNLRWISEPDRGQAHAVNKGIDMADGVWVIWLNADDYFLSGAFNIFEDAINEHPNNDVIYSDFLQIRNNNRGIYRKFSTPPSKFIHKHLYLFTGNHSTLFNREFIEDLGGVSEEYEYVMDAELLWRVLDSDADLTYAPGFVAVRRIHDDAKTVKNSDKSAAEGVKMKRNLYGQTNIDRVLPEEFLQAIAVSYLTIYYIKENRWDAAKAILARILKQIYS